MKAGRVEYLGKHPVVVVMVGGLNLMRSQAPYLAAFMAFVWWIKKVFA